nr:zf-HC2 domain-containing protein [Aneurinibacillus sp. XH2]
MNCAEVQDLIEIYTDLPPDDERRLRVDEHVNHCTDCKNELQIWIESAEWIAREEALPSSRPAAMEGPQFSSRVMNRIYEQESWRTPVSDRIYSISYKVRRRLTAFISFCLALFMFSFLYSLVYRPAPESQPVESGIFGFHQAVSAADNYAEPSLHTQVMMQSASSKTAIIEPLKLGPIQTYPDYLLVISFLGLIAALLIMNWLSRIRA